MNGIMQSVGASRKVFEYMNRIPKIPNDGECTNNVQVRSVKYVVNYLRMLGLLNFKSYEFTCRER